MQEQSLCCSCCPWKRDAEAQRGWLVQVWHQATSWAAQIRIQKEQSESCNGAMPNNNIYIPQHCLLL